MQGETAQRFAGLDGLRAVAAAGVLLYHVAGWSGRPGPFAHGYLAVDFFFGLSGFVLAHAFERREIGWSRYLSIRVIRIWPMLVLATLIGATLTWRHSPPFWSNLVRGLLLIPRLGHAADWTFPTLFPFNPPAWSLCLEVVVSAAWFPLRRMPNVAFGMILVVCFSVMAWASSRMHGVETGWDQATFWIGLARAAYSFSLGVLAWRLRGWGPRPRLWLAAVLLIIALFAPLPPRNEIYDLACVTFVFPLLVLLGASDPKGAVGSLCRTTGDLSYPVYALHWAIWAVMLGLYAEGWRPGQPLWFCALSLVLIPLAAWAALRFYDRPLRRWLSR